METVDLKTLKRGDIIIHKQGGGTYVVDVNYGNRATASRTVDITNPSEWNLMIDIFHRTKK